MKTPTMCDSCGELGDDVIARDDLGDSPLCGPCRRAALEHGHAHGLHVDEDGDEIAIADCPLCERGQRHWTVEAISERMRTEITQDIAAGVVPADVRSFSALHDYVDANEYGGLCTVGCPLKADSDADTAVINAAQGAVDAWLQAGRP